MASAAKKHVIEDVAILDAMGCPLLPEIVRRAFRQAPACMIEEESLWRLVAARAALDAVGVTGFGPSQMKRHLDAVIDSQKWWRDEWDYVREVFDRANVCVDGVRELMSRFFMNEQNQVVFIPNEGKAVSNEIHQAERSIPGPC
jgi:hypothetical protein